MSRCQGLDTRCPKEREYRVIVLLEYIYSENNGGYDAEQNYTFN